MVKHVKRHHPQYTGTQAHYNERILITTTYHTVTFKFNIYHEFTAHVSYVTDDNVLIPHSLYEKWHTLYTQPVMCVLLVRELLLYCYDDGSMHCDGPLFNALILLSQ